MLVKDFATCNPKNKPSNSFEYINYIDTSSVYDGKLLEVKKLFSNYPSRAQRTIEINDILISSVRPALRHNFFVKESIKNGVASTGYIQIRLNKNIVIPRYLYYFLTAEPQIANYATIAETSQSTFPAFNKEIIENLEFPNIPLHEQQHIVNLTPLIRHH
jgi:type I restriction enzyme S subunit